MNSKYEPLYDYLRFDRSKKIQMSFEQVEKILGFDLPKSATVGYGAYWYNSETHRLGIAIENAGYRAHPNVKSKIVIFERKF